ncbi:MAG: PP2C family protein-serine/threonine phosphatase [Planctomycetota bacterium]
MHHHSIEKARLERSLEIASEIQGGLMPQVPNDLEGLDVHGWYRSAEKTSGDFYDFVRTRSGKLAVVVGDVTGHGIGPALITATAQASLRSYLRILEDPGEALTMLNQDLSERLEDGLFLTLFLAIVGEDGTVHALNAGHTPPLVWRAATGEIETIAGHGPALGMMDDFKFEEHSTLTLEPGDYLVAFTDGLTEARSLEEPDLMFDEAGVRKTLEECASDSRDAVALTEEIVTRALSFAKGNREDDMTLVCLQRAAE